MNKKFCSNCNQVTFYEDKLPAGCSSCLQPFAGTIVAQIQPVQTVRQPKRTSPRSFEEQLEKENNRNNNYDEDDENNNQFIPPEFKLEIETSNLPIRETLKFENLAFDKSPKEKLNRPKEKKINKKQFEEQWRSQMQKTTLELGGEGE